MTGKQLKNSILQWAIQGKLVPQDPNDEPASVLLEKIRAEKARLVKEGKIKKDKKESIIYRGDDNSHYEKFADGTVVCIDDEIPFDVPNGWEWCRISDIASIVGGYAYKSYDFISSSQNQVLRLGNIKNDFLKLDASPVYISDDLAIKTEKFRCHLDDILITMTGTRKKRDYFFSYKVKSINHDCFINQRVGAIRFYIKELSNYMIYALKAESILHNVFQYETGTANQGNLGSENIAKVFIPLPPLAEQHRIVEKIQELLPVVDQYDSAQSKLDNLNKDIKPLLRKSILQEAIQGRLVPQDPNDKPAAVLLQRIKEEKLRLVKEGKLKKKNVVDSVIFKGDDNRYFEKIGKEVTCIDEDIPFEIPESWCWVRLDSVCKYIQRGKSPKYSLVKKYPVIAQKCNQWSGFSIDKAQFIEPISLSSYGEERKLQDRDLLWNSTGLGTLGRMAIYYSRLNPYELAVADSHVTVIRPLKEYVLSEYLYAYFASNTVQSVIEDKSDGSTKQKELATSTVKSYLIPLPPIDEQKRIVAKIDEALAGIMSR
ncbi:type I restriction enzyme, S subunit [Bacteroidales bacterium KHT7]|nr:type I restriction enzyme, S subunit [Bacteroidales bacterium KHT7]